jgi:hypothetical protein
MDGARARATRPGNRLLAVAALFAVVLAVVGTLLAVSSYHAQRERAIDSLSVRAQASVASAGMFVRSRLQLLGLAAADPVFETGDGQRIDVAFARMRPDALGFTGGLAWVDRDGIVRAATTIGVLGHDVSAENVMRAARSGRPVVGALDRSAALMGAVVPLAAPTKDRRGHRNGELLAGIGDEFIRRAASVASERYQGDVGILDRAGRLIAGPDVVAPRPVGGALVRLARREPTGTAMDIVGISGRPDRIVGWGSTEPAGWTLFLERSAGDVLGPPLRRLVLTLVVLLLIVAVLLATAWAVARRLDRTAARAFGVALRLQLSLLPENVPDVAGADVAVRYRPGTAGLEVGGDWYDVVDLGDGRAGVSVGDIVGRGLNAAVVMGRLRSAVSALAVTGGGPASVLRGLERFVQRTDATPFATIAYAEVDARAGRVRYGCAGHPPPLVVGPGRSARFLGAARGTPLGTFAGLPYDEAEEELPPGAALVLYTDGLVERRDEAIDRSLERLRALAAEHAGESATELADALLGALAGAPEDDVAILCLRVREARRAEREGFEPSDEVDPRHTISSRARSAAPAPLLDRQQGS